MSYAFILFVVALAAGLVSARRERPTLSLPGQWGRDRGYTLFMLSGVPRRGSVVRFNSKTAWVRFRNGDLVKRHLTKHWVSFERAQEVAR